MLDMVMYTPLPPRAYYRYLAGQYEIMCVYPPNVAPL